MMVGGEKHVFFLYKRGLSAEVDLFTEKCMRHISYLDYLDHSGLSNLWSLSKTHHDSPWPVYDQLFISYAL